MIGWWLMAESAGQTQSNEGHVSALVSAQTQSCDPAPPPPLHLNTSLSHSVSVTVDVDEQDRDAAFYNQHDNWRLNISTTF